MSGNRICYVVTSGGHDVYSAMTRLSVASVRISSPDIRVSVICDTDTDLAIKSTGDSLRHEVDEWLVHSSMYQEPAARNRDLKTKLRLLIDGPFMFLDSDTLVRADMAAAFCGGGDLAAAANNSSDIYAEQIVPANQKIVHSMGWNTRSDVYFNGGVLFYDDSPNARLFAEEWHTKWTESYSKGHGVYDQPALNAAIFAKSIECARLDTIFNTQIVNNLMASPDAVVWHYYSSYTILTTYIFAGLIESAKGNEPVDCTALRAVLDKRHPFNSSYRETWMGWKAVQSLVDRVKAASGNQGRLAGSLRSIGCLDRELKLQVEDLAFNQLRIENNQHWRRLLMHMLWDQPIPVIKRMASKALRSVF